MSRGLRIGMLALYIIVVAVAAYGAFTAQLVVSAVTLFVASLILSAASPRFGIALLLVVASTDGFVKRWRPVPEAFVLKDAVVIALILGIIVRIGLRKSKAPLPWDGFGAWSSYIAVLLFSAASTVASPAEALASLRARGFFSLLYAVGAFAIDSFARLRAVCALVIGCVSGAAAVGLFQASFPYIWEQLGPGFVEADRRYLSFSTVAGLTQAHERAYGCLVDPSALGIACAYAIMLAFGLLSTSHRASRPPLILAILVLTAGLVASQTRSAMFGAALGVTAIFVLLVSMRGRRGAAMFVGVVALIAFAVGTYVLQASNNQRLGVASNTYAAQTRERSALAVLSGALRRPLGVGLGATGAGGRFRPGLENDLAVDNLYLATLYENGFLGLAALLFVHGSFLILAIRRAREGGRAGPIFAALAGGHLALLGAGAFTQGAFDYAPGGIAFWTLSGALAIPSRYQT